VNAVSTNLRSPDRGLSKRRATVGTQADRRDVVRVCALVLALWVGGTARAADPPDCERHIDRSYDVVIRRTDLGLAGTIDPSLHRPVELLSITLGRWSPTDAQNDLFAGAFAPGGGFVRLDVELDGLRNPPGKSNSPGFNPFQYGDHPVYGFIEIDMDNDNETGGEVNAPEYRYLGNIARFGGLPEEGRFHDRLAEDASAFDGDFSTEPYVERSGEEFHLALLGGQFDPPDITVILGDADNMFESGETWDVVAPWFHRAHGFEPYSIASGGTVPGEYTPNCTLRFRHDHMIDRTTLSLVFPLNNAAAASTSGEMPQPNNHDPSDQASVFEALNDLSVSAGIIEMFPTGEPEEELILGWKDKAPGSFMNVREWKTTALLGNSYTTSGFGFYWTDAWPDPLRGNVNGENQLSQDDRDEVFSFIADHDDDDGTADGRVELSGFAADFSVFDINHDGVVEDLDAQLVSVEGDGDEDGDVDLADFSRLQRCDTWTTGGAVGDCGLFDLDADGDVDLGDFNWFLSSCTGPAIP
jgi:hypothetical protein